MNATLEILRRFSRDLGLLSEHGNIQVVREGNNLKLTQNDTTISVPYILTLVAYKGKNGVITSRHRIEIMNQINELLIEYGKDDSRIYVDVNGSEFFVYQVANDFLSKKLISQIDVIPINGWIWRKFLV